VGCTDQRLHAHRHIVACPRNEHQGKLRKQKKKRKKASTPTKDFGKSNPAGAVPGRKSDPLSAEEGARMDQIMAKIEKGPISAGMANRERLVASSPNQPHILKVYGLLLFLQGRIREVMPVLDRIQALESTNTAVPQPWGCEAGSEGFRGSSGGP
jgi:hypothetical protein